MKTQILFRCLTVATIVMALVELGTAVYYGYVRLTYDDSLGKTIEYMFYWVDETRHWNNFWMMVVASILFQSAQRKANP